MPEIGKPYRSELSIEEKLGMESVVKPDTLDTSPENVKRRQRFFRGVRLTLECGHEAVLPSSYWRLSAALVGVLVGHAVRGGVWCQRCSALCQPEQVLGTVRLEEA